MIFTQKCPRCNFIVILCLLEPDVYYVLGFTINGTQRAKDYVTLSKLLYQYPQWRNSIVLGPSVTMLVKEISRKYLQEYVSVTVKYDYT